MKYFVYFLVAVIIGVFGTLFVLENNKVNQIKDLVTTVVGPKGDKGDSGASGVGIAGSRGIKGDTGPVAWYDSKGEKGDKGDKGDSGSGGSGSSSVAGWTDDGTVVRLTTSTDLVGIGTTVPLAKLDVHGTLTNAPIASFSGSTSFAGLVVDNSGLGDVFTASSSGLPRFVVAQDGNVGVGTTLPAAKLEVVAPTTTITIAAPTNVAGAFDYSSGDYSAGGYSHNIHVYAYKVINGVRIYSAGYGGLGTNITDDNSFNSYFITWSWNPVAGADGYRVLKWDDTGSGQNFNGSYDTTATTIVDGSNGGASFYGSPGVTPTSVSGASNAVSVPNGSVGIGTLSQWGAVNIAAPVTNYTVGDPTNVAGVIEYGSGYYWASGYSHNIRVYAYRDFNGTRVYSSGYATLGSVLTDDNSDQSYSITWSWDAVAGADGYRVLDYNTYNPNNYDRGYDVATNSFNDYCNGDTCYQGDVVVTPTSLSVGNALIVSSGRVGFGTTAPQAGFEADGRVILGGAGSGSNLLINGGNDTMTGEANTALGYQALLANTSGNNNIAIGPLALTANTTGQNNVALGRYSLIAATSGSNNLAFGDRALRSLVTGSYNIAFGSFALSTVTTGDANVAIGQDAGRYNTGSGSVFIGNEAGTYEQGSGKLYISNSASSDPLIKGDFTNSYLNVNGTVQVAGGGISFNPVKGTTSTGLGGSKSVYVSGNYAYVASAGNNTLAIFNISHPDNIVARGTTTENLNFPMGVYVSGNWAYVVGAHGLSIFDISHPDNIVAHGTTTQNLNAGNRVVVSGNYAYVADASAGLLAIFDVTDKDNIVAKATTTENLNYISDLFVKDGFAYVADTGTTVLAIFDVSNPESIVAHGTVSTGAYNVFVAGNYAYVDNFSGLTIFDISNPDGIVTHGTTSVDFSAPGPVFVSGNYAYVAGWNNELSIYDISDPDNILALDTAGFAQVSSLTGLFVSGDYAYMTGYDSGMTIIDISHNVLNKQYFNSLNVTGSTAIGDVPSDQLPQSNMLYVSGNVGVGATNPWAKLVVDNGGSGDIFAASNSGQGKFVISSSGNVGIATESATRKLDVNGSAKIAGGDIYSHPYAKGTISTNLTNPTSVVVSGNYAYVGDLNSRFAIFDVSDPNNIVARGTIVLGFEVQSVFISGHYAYVGGYPGFAILDIADPDNIVAHASIDHPPYNVYSVYVSGSYAYVAADGALHIYDISNPDNIVAHEVVTTGLVWPMGVYVSGNYAYVADANASKLAIFDIFDPDAVVAHGTITTNLSYPQSVVVSGNYAYVANVSNNTLAIFDVTDKDNIVAKATATANLSSPVSVIVSGNYAYLVNYISGGKLTIFDVTDKDNIVARGTTSENLDGSYGVFVKDSYAYVVNQYNSKLAIFDVSNPDLPRQHYNALDVFGSTAIGAVPTTPLSQSNMLYVSGNVGIGTINPGFKLDLQDAQAATAAAMVFNTNTGTEAAGLAVKLGFLGMGDTTNSFITFLNGNGEVQGRITSDGASGVTYATSGIDLAEYFAADPAFNAVTDFAPGTVVCQGPKGIVPCGLTGTRGSRPTSNVIGVVSAHPAFLGGIKGPNKVTVGLLGQLPVRVTSSLAIASGDLLTMDISHPGFVTRATDRGLIVGKALEDWAPGGESKTVLVAWQPGYYEGEAVLAAATTATESGKLSIDQMQQELADLKLNMANLNVATSEIGTVAANLTVVGKTQLAETTVGGNLTVGLVTISDIKGDISSLAGDLSLQNGLITIAQNGDLNIKSGRLIGNGQVRGISVAVVSGQSEIKVTFTNPRPNGDYAVTVTPSWLTNVSVSEKVTTGFTVKFATAAPVGGTIDWLIID